MRALNLAVASLLVSGMHPSAADPDRSWQAGQVQQVQRVLNTKNSGDHWEYTLLSNGVALTVRNGGGDAPYLNSSLGSEVKIASAVSSSAQPYDGGELYVMDAKGKEHKMDLVSAVIADAGCKK
jgi:hypothetical protein